MGAALVTLNQSDLPGVLREALRAALAERSEFDNAAVPGPAFEAELDRMAKSIARALLLSSNEYVDAMTGGAESRERPFDQSAFVREHADSPYRGGKR